MAAFIFKRKGRNQRIDLQYMSLTAREPFLPASEVTAILTAPSTVITYTNPIRIGGPLEAIPLFRSARPSSSFVFAFQGLTCSAVACSKNNCFHYINFAGLPPVGALAVLGAFASFFVPQSGHDLAAESCRLLGRARRLALGMSELCAKRAITYPQKTSPADRSPSGKRRSYSTALITSHSQHVRGEGCLRWRVAETSCAILLQITNHCRAVANTLFLRKLEVLSTAWPLDVSDGDTWLPPQTHFFREVLP